MTLMVCTWPLSAQTHTYHGTVLDAANNEPLIGATVMPVGGGQGTAADVDGKFTLTVPANVTQATITYVGYKEQTVKLQNNMVVYLTSTSSNLDDVVVVAYGTANKESLTGSVAMVGTKEIEDRPVTSVTAALEGNAPGVQVNNSTGTPGSAPTIRIRGFNSINGSNTPLYVVDGIPFEGTIADLNPQDIESMSVLKDAASSALYGNRGANGVILITTKKAKTAGKIDVSLQVRQGMYDRALPFYDRQEIPDWMQTQFTSYANGLYRQEIMNNPDTKLTYADVVKNLAGGSIINDYLYNNIFGVENSELFDPTTGKYCGAPPLPGYTDLDWWDAVARNGYRQEYNANIASATEKFNMFASLGYLKENGYMIGTDFDRFSARVNTNVNPVSYLKLGLNLSASQQESETGQADDSNLDAVNNPFHVEGYAPIYPYYNHNADGSIILDENGQPTWNVAGYNQGTNVAWEQLLNVNNFSRTTLDGSAYVTAVIPYGFELTVRGQYYRNKTNTKEYNNNIVGSQKGSGMFSKYFYAYKSHTFQQTLSWNHDYDYHHIDVLLAHENYNYEQEYDFVRKAQQLLEGHLELNNFSDIQYANSGSLQRRVESYLARARYNYAQKYYGEFSVRRDGSSRFSKDNRWGTFWSVGASWVLSKEKFMQDLTWLNFLKLRAAYGSVGNDASAGAYSSYTLYDWMAWPGGPGQTLVPSTLGTPGLKWETTKTFDVALEGSLFDDRFNFSIGYFNKVNSDLLFKVRLPNSIGTLPGGYDQITGEGTAGANPSIWQNVGTMKNYGWELQIGVDIIRNTDWKWNFSLDATFLKNKVTKLPDGHDLPAQNLYIGKSLYNHKEYHWAGVDQLTGQSMYEIIPDSPDFWTWDEQAGHGVYSEEQFMEKVNQAKADKKHVFIEQDGKYYTSNTAYASRKLCGTSLPTVYGSFGSNVSWKGINLGLLFTYSLGGKTYDSNYQSLMSAGTVVRALHKDLLNSWTAAPAGMTEDSPNRIDPNAIPQVNALYSQYNNDSSDRWLTSNNYLTLKNINLSYDFPTNWVNALRMQSINIGMSIDNVFIAAKRKGMNPQYGFQGGQGRYYVPARVFAFQLNLKF